MTPLLPGATLGVLGGGQLGRMLAAAARRLGYRTLVFSPEPASPAGQWADGEIAADYQDRGALERFASRVDAVTVEFENIPSTALEALQSLVPVRPGPQVLHATQNRGREKAFLAAHGIPHVESAYLEGPQDLEGAIDRIGLPAVLKTAGFGYDGKGQVVVRNGDEHETALAQLRGGPGVLERLVSFRREVSVLVARSPSGEMRAYRPIENRHERQILDLSSVPARCSAATADSALEIAGTVAEALDAVGLICVEFFELEGGDLLVNEIAPRPHNSGHLTIEGCATSQFEQQLRAVSGLPLGDTGLHRPAAMANLLGDLWGNGEPDWESLLAVPGVALHLYGKAEPRPGRKMGHLTAVADSVDEALRRVVAARAAAAGGRGARPESPTT